MNKASQLKVFIFGPESNGEPRFTPDLIRSLNKLGMKCYLHSSSLTLGAKLNALLGGFKVSNLSLRLDEQFHAIKPDVVCLFGEQDELPRLNAAWKIGAPVIALSSGRPAINIVETGGGWILPSLSLHECVNLFSRLSTEPREFRWVKRLAMNASYNSVISPI